MTVPFSPKNILKFRPDGHFRILMVSDIHGGVGYDETRTVAALKALLEAAKPDLVLLGGDIAGPGVIHIETAPQLREMLDGLCAPMERRGIPWAHVYGNHDDNFGLSNAAQQPVYEAFPHCVSHAGPADVPGVGNYALPILDAAGETPLFCVYGLDSHQGMAENGWPVPEGTVFLDNRGPTRGGEAPISPAQIQWYRQTSQALEAFAGRKVPGLMYFHIPLPEHALVARYPELCQMEGHNDETVSCSRINSGLFAACLERGDVKAIFCGHDHENDFSGVYCGIRLGFDGFLSYHACHREDIRGGRIFDISAADPWNIQTAMLRVRDLPGCPD